MPVTGNVSPTDLARIVAISKGGSARIVLLSNPHVLYCLSVTNVLGGVEFSAQSSAQSGNTGWRFSRFDVFQPVNPMDCAVASANTACLKQPPREDLPAMDLATKLPEAEAAAVPRVAVYVPQFVRHCKLYSLRRQGLSWTKGEFDFRSRSHAAALQSRGKEDFLLIVAEDTTAVRTYVVFAVLW